MSQGMEGGATAAPPHASVELALAWAQEYYNSGVADPANHNKHDLDLCWALLKYLHLKSREPGFNEETRKAAAKLLADLMQVQGTTSDHAQTA